MEYFLFLLGHLNQLRFMIGIMFNLYLMERMVTDF